MTDQEFDSLDPNLQWIVTEARRPVTVDAGARRRLVEALRSEPLPTRRSPALQRLLRPAQLAIPPLAAAAIAAGLVAVGFFGGYSIHRDGRLSAEQQSAVVAGRPQLPDSVMPRAV